MDPQQLLAKIESKSRSLLERGLQEQALLFVRQALDDALAKVEKEHPFVVNLKDHLSNVLLHLGQTEEAVLLREDTLESKRHALGLHPYVAQAANNLAEVYRKTGSLTKARTLYQEALEIEDHPVYWNNLGLLYTEIGALEDAEKCIRFCLEADLKELGAESPETAVTKDNLSFVLFQIADIQEGDVAQQTLEEAQTLMDDAIRVFRANGKSVSLLRCMANRIVHLVQLVRLDEAIAVGLEADQLAQELAPKSVLQSEIWNRLGEAYLANNNFVEAIAKLKKIVDGKPELSMASHARSKLADCYLQVHQMVDAAHELKKALYLDAKNMASRIGIESEGGRASLCSRPFEQVKKLLFISFHSPEEVSSHEALQHVLRWKNLKTDIESLYSRNVDQSENCALKEAFCRLKDHHQSIVATALKGSGVEISSFYEDLKELKKTNLMLEGELASLMASSGGKETLEKTVSEWLDTVTVSAISEKLPEDSVLVLYLAVPMKKSQNGSSGQYIAITLDEKEQVKTFELGSETEINMLIHSAVPRFDGLSRDIGLDLNIATMPDQTRDLRMRILDPILDWHALSTRFLLVPDSQLWTVPFEALPIDGGGYIIDKFNISYAHNGRAVLGFGSDPGPFTQPIVIGDPDYDLNLNIQIVERIPQLPGTLTESTAVADMLSVSPIQACDATKSVVTNARSPVVLHLATHGVFDLDETFKLKRFQPIPWDLMSEGLIGSGYHKEIKLWEGNPMYRSMLIFAGANAFLDSYDLPDSVGNGLLTAAELTTVDLSATELVVLSACNTLRGDLEGGAVRGLSSAIAQAGAKTALLSLWPVPDTTTQMLMNDFYAHLLEGDGRAQALRRAKLKLRNKNVASWQWAAFECLGEPGPLPPSVRESF